MVGLGVRTREVWESFGWMGSRGPRGERGGEAGCKGGPFLPLPSSAHWHTGSSTVGIRLRNASRLKTQPRTF